MASPEERCAWPVQLHGHRGLEVLMRAMQGNGEGGGTRGCKRLWGCHEGRVRYG